MSAAVKALGDLLRDSEEWRAFFRRSCEEGPLRLRAVVHQWCAELEDRGHTVALEDLEDALTTAARKLLPDSPGARWDPEWASRTFKSAVARMGERYARLTEAEQEALSFSDQHPWEDGLQAAYVANDPAAYRAALEGWERAGLEAIEAIGRQGAA